MYVFQVAASEAVSVGTVSVSGVGVGFVLDARCWMLDFGRNMFLPKNNPAEIKTTNIKNPITNNNFLGNAFLGFIGGSGGLGVFVSSG